MKDEPTWKPIPGWEGIYAVSDRGVVRRVKAAPGTRVGYCLSPAIHHAGYERIALCCDGRRTYKFVHRAVLEAFTSGPPTPKHQVNHIDCCKTNNTLENLEWVTPKQNTAHAIANGLR